MLRSRYKRIGLSETQSEAQKIMLLFVGLAVISFHARISMSFHRTYFLAF
jgi:hypothetical protein